MDVFGLGDAAEHIGTPQSIAIRNPDCSVATHLINFVGPIAVTSANPTGEADTTHHNQVYAKLGKRVDGVLCDGPSQRTLHQLWLTALRLKQGTLASSEWVSFLNQRFFKFSRRFRSDANMGR
ncbi:hypothetical protein FQN60_010393 [Etheostoma spectabile]|uniref:Threonylcarbamoyl-AMP synthase n=1 Tax=Etheostoma spectabile TaxID=54343 RepID=A0A5J5D2Y1_9PERO|nr:hypothetical protein FQN60_010393 [Etheostoma spectabile]